VGGGGCFFSNTPIRPLRGPPTPNQFRDRNPCGVGCARLATLAFARPPSQGLGGSSQRANYRKLLTPTSPTRLSGPNDCNCEAMARSDAAHGCLPIGQAHLHHKPGFHLRQFSRRFAKPGRVERLSNHSHKADSNQPPKDHDFFQANKNAQK